MSTAGLRPRIGITPYAQARALHIYVVSSNWRIHVALWQLCSLLKNGKANVLGLA